VLILIFGSKREDLAYVLEQTFSEIVVKVVGESGGYGMLMDPTAIRARIEEFRRQIQADPRNFIPTRASAFTCPILRSGAGMWLLDATWISGRYCSTTERTVTIVPGGLTRVALQEGSLMLNHQGGGSKDTWVLRGED